MKSKSKFTFFSDPGHGWLKVNISDLPMVGLKLSDVTRYSYQHGDNLYLEEDCDAFRFIKAYETKFGKIIYKEKTCNGRSRIRNFERINP